jgi:carbonic anhydrase
MDAHKKLLLANKAWVNDRLNLRPDYFDRMAEDQSPEFMWIGCSDSRVPAEEITGTEPGEIFVHRNIANVVVHTDFNLLSVLQFAVEVLKVKHVIVCGHYNCGGIKNALSHKHLGLINKWLRHIKDVYRLNKDELEAINSPDKRLDRFVELNVIEQVNNLAQTSIIQKSWKQNGTPLLHGWVYDIRNGYLKDLCNLDSNSKLDDIYTFDFQNVSNSQYSEDSDG